MSTLITINGKLALLEAIYRGPKKIEIRYVCFLPRWPWMINAGQSITLPCCNCINSFMQMKGQDKYDDLQLIISNSCQILQSFSGKTLPEWGCPECFEMFYTKGCTETAVSSYSIERSYSIHLMLRHAMQQNATYHCMY